MDDTLVMDNVPATQELNVQAGIPDLPSEPAPPIDSRFLFVDVAALRAKQLRRGARVRFNAEPSTASAIKLERVAMEEVRRGLVHYTIPHPTTHHPAHRGEERS